MNTIRFHQEHRRRLVLARVAILLAVALGAPVAVAQPASAAPAPTYIWTGFAADLGNTNWSEGSNWAGGVAPTASGPVSLVFPAPVTCSTPNCTESNNDLTGLTVENFTVADRPSLRFTGNGITLTGDVSIARSPRVELALSITLGAPTSTWTIDDTNAVVNQPVVGPTFVTISLANESLLEVGSVSFNTPGVALLGADPEVAPAANGIVHWTAGTTSVVARDVALRGRGSTIGGHLVTDTVDLELAFFAFGVFVHTDLAVQGNAILDAASSIVAHRGFTQSPLPPHTSQHYLSHLAVNGSLDLGSAAITIDMGNACNPLDLVLPVATSAPNQLSGTFTRPVPGGRQPVPDGAIIAGINAPATCGSGTSSHHRINYDYAAGRVTATAVPAPTVAVATSHTPTVPELPITYTATVSPSPGGGTVSFLDNGASVDGCDARPVSPADGQATCTTSYGAPGNHAITATFSGTEMLPPAGPSPAIIQVVVPPPTAVITSQTGVSSLGTPIEGTASDVGGPGLLGVVLYFHSYTGGPSGAVLATCTSCGPGQTTSTWSFTPPVTSVPGTYAFVAQAFDVASNPGPASNVIYQAIS